MSDNTAKAKLFGRRVAAPLFAQVLSLVLVTLAAAQAVNLWIVFNVPPSAPEMYRLNEVESALFSQQTPAAAGRNLVSRVVQNPSLRGANDERLERFLASEMARRIGVPPEDVRLSMVLDPRSSARQTVRAVRTMMGESWFRSGQNHFIVGPFEIAIHRPDGLWTIVEPERIGLLSPWQARILLWFSISLLALAPIAYLFARRLSSPIASFALAAERLGRDPTAPPIRLTGPTEIGIAVSAFNDMQDRLRRYVQDRTAMIGAVAHDLRTPLTRLRFRVEGAPDPMRAKMTTDIEQMEQMIAATMAFVRDASQPAERARLELSSLVQSIADEMADTGADVEATSGKPVVVEGDPVALRRLVTNLLDNAIKFGGRAKARVYAEGGAAVIEVDDEGPGICDTDKERLFEPFFRGERSRSRETGGAGLGLAIVRSVARAHGGDAMLQNRPEGGLRARATLPL